MSNIENGLRKKLLKLCVWSTGPHGKLENPKVIDHKLLKWTDKIANESFRTQARKRSMEQGGNMTLLLGKAHQSLVK